MTTSTPPQTSTKMLGFLRAFTLGCVILLWTLAWLVGWHTTPRPEFFAILLGLSLLGGTYLLCKGVFKFNDLRNKALLANFLLGLVAWSLAALFAYEVLGNEEDIISGSGQAHRWGEELG